MGTMEVPPGAKRMRANTEEELNNHDAQPPPDIILPTYGGNEGVHYHVGSLGVFRHSVLRTIRFSLQSLIDAFLFLTEDRTSIHMLHRTIRASMTAWGVSEDRIPKIEHLARALLMTVSAEDSYVTIGTNPAPPHDAIYFLDSLKRDAYAALVLGQFVAPSGASPDALVGIASVITIIRAVLFPVIANDDVASPATHSGEIASAATTGV